MRKLSMVLLLLMSATVLLPARAADTTISLNFPAGGAYFNLYVPFASGDQIVIHLDCDLQSTGYYTVGSIDPYIELYNPAGNFVTSADDTGGNDCAGFNDAIFEYTITTSGTYRLLAEDLSGNGGTGTLTITGSSLVTVTVNNAAPLAADGRLNPDPSAPVVLYCQGDNYDIYQLVGSKGILVIRELRDELDAMENPAENILLASSEDGTVRLYLLTTGEFQLNAPLNDNPNGYVFIFSDCSQRGAGISSPSNIAISAPTVDNSREPLSFTAHKR